MNFWLGLLVVAIGNVVLALCVSVVAWRLGFFDVDRLVERDVRRAGAASRPEGDGAV